MAEIVLNEEETLALGRILRCYLSDLRMEIADTDSMDFRLGLKREEEFIRDLLDRLGQPVTWPAG